MCLLAFMGMFNIHSWPRWWCSIVMVVLIIWYQRIVGDRITPDSVSLAIISINPERWTFDGGSSFPHEGEFSQGLFWDFKVKCLVDNRIRKLQWNYLTINIFMLNEFFSSLTYFYLWVVWDFSNNVEEIEDIG